MGKRVLVVDDDVAIRRMIATVLVREGYEVDEAFSGGHALESIAWDGYAAIVLDLMMPVISGFDVLRAISQVRPNSHCVILMSAAAPTTLDKVQSSLVRARLRKPFNLPELVEAVRACAEDQANAISAGASG